MQTPETIPPEGLALPDSDGTAWRRELSWNGKLATIAGVVVGAALVVRDAAGASDAGGRRTAILGIVLAAVAIATAMKPRRRRRALERELKAAGGAPWASEALWRRGAVVALVPWPPKRSKPWALVVLAAAAFVAITVWGVCTLFELGTPSAPWLLTPLIALLAFLLLTRERQPKIGLRFESFPCFAGERATLRFLLHGAADAVTLSEVWLRCIRETPRGGSAGWDVRIVRLMAPSAQEPAPQDPRDVLVGFDVPSDAPPTELLGPPVVRWEVVVWAERDGRRFVGAAPAPVYARPAATGA